MLLRKLNLRIIWKELLVVCSVLLFSSAVVAISMPIGHVVVDARDIALKPDIITILVECWAVQSVQQGKG